MLGPKHYATTPRATEYCSSASSLHRPRENGLATLQTLQDSILLTPCSTPNPWRVSGRVNTPSWVLRETQHGRVLGHHQLTSSSLRGRGREETHAPDHGGVRVSHFRRVVTAAEPVLGWSHRRLQRAPLLRVRRLPPRVLRLAVVLLVALPLRRSRRRDCDGGLLPRRLRLRRRRQTRPLPRPRVLRLDAGREQPVAAAGVRRRGEERQHLRTVAMWGVRKTAGRGFSPVPL
jgi:hypothetical protein